MTAAVLGGTGRRRQGAADGKVDLPILQADHHDFDILPFGQMLMDVVDIGMGNL